MRSVLWVGVGVRPSHIFVWEVMREGLIKGFSNLAILFGYNFTQLVSLHVCECVWMECVCVWRGGGEGVRKECA